MHPARVPAVMRSPTATAASCRMADQGPQVTAALCFCRQFNESYACCPVRTWLNILSHNLSASAGNLPQQSSSAVGHNRQSSRGAAQDASAASSRQPKVLTAAAHPHHVHLPRLSHPLNISKGKLLTHGCILAGAAQQRHAGQPHPGTVPSRGPSRLFVRAGEDSQQAVTARHPLCARCCMRLTLHLGRAPRRRLRQHQRRSPPDQKPTWMRSQSLAG